MRALEAASPRVKVFSIGQTEEGREIIVVAIANEETIANLDRYREITRKLADPRKITDDEARRADRARASRSTTPPARCTRRRPAAPRC